MSELKPFPITTGFFAMPLGLGALALAWLNAKGIFIYAEQVGNIIAVISVVFWVVLIVSYIYRVIFCFEQIKAEFCHPVQCNLFSLVTMTTMMTGDMFYLWGFSLGKPIIFLGVGIHLLFLIFVIGRLWKGTQFLPDTLHPVHYLPPIAASFTMGSSFGLIGLQDIGSLFFGVGIFSWLAHEPIMLQRMRLSPLFPIARPSLGIIFAPSFVGAAAYLAIGGEADLFFKMLLGYGFVQFCFVLRNIGWIAENGFSMGFWAFSFGLSSMARVSVELYQMKTLSIIGLGGFMLANLGIGILSLFTIRLLLQQKFITE